MLAKKSLPLSSVMMKAGKSFTSILRTASIPSSGKSTTSTDFISVSYTHLDVYKRQEVGYGISNIFRFLRIDFIHRLTHLEHLPHHEAPPKFRIKIAFQIRL